MTQAERETEQVKALCREIANNPDWPILKSVIYTEILDSTGFGEVRRAFGVIESLGASTGIPEQNKGYIKRPKEDEKPPAVVEETGADVDLEETL